MKNQPEHTPLLAQINTKILADGENLPKVTLKDGSSVQTGTVATMLHNISLYNSGQQAAVEAELIAAVPTLIKIGLFDLFSPDEWMMGNNAGRRFVGQQAKKLLDTN